MIVKKCAYMFFTIIAEYRHFWSIVPVEGVQDLLKEKYLLKSKKSIQFSY